MNFSRLTLPHLLRLVTWLGMTVSVSWSIANEVGRRAAPTEATASLQVAPEGIELSAGPAAQQLLVTWTDGTSEVDRTANCQYHSTNPAVASVTAEGLVRVHGTGTAEIEVRGGDLQRVVTVRGVPAGSERQVYFTRDVVPILTKLDCNSGGCHGKATGQNGFALSLLGYEPHWDYEAIVREARGRRVSVTRPEQSLLLLKATGIVPHGGGARLDVVSDDYQMLVEWIRSGARPPQRPSSAVDDASSPRPVAADSSPDPVVERVTVLPARRVLAVSGRQQLLVTAHFSDGTSRDVTRQAIFASNEPEIADVDEQGVVQTRDRGGLFAVMVRYGDEFAVFHGTVPLAAEVRPDPSVWAHLESRLGNHPVDRHLLAAWKRLGIEPSSPASDGEFLRRVTLDLCGRLPTEDEWTAYLADAREDKQERLVERLLSDKGHASYFALKWADILQNRGRGYGTSAQRPGTTLFASWLRDVVEQNRPYDQFVTELLTATGSQETHPPTLWYRSVRSQEDYVESVSQVFLGVRLQCAQCHHHPAERLSQEDYYSLAAVFARVGRKGGFADAEVPTNEMLYLRSEGEVIHPRTGEVMAPRPLGGEPFPLTRYDDPRQHFARWLTAKENPFFARTMANRVWAHFFGRGIIHPLDDARSTNPPSNPELLDQLTREFVASNYDMRHLIRLCVLSHAYQLSSLPTETNRGDEQSFARFYPRRLPAEVLLDALSDVLGVPTPFPAGGGTFPLGTRAIELPDEAVPSHFLDVFGRPARSTACECERVDAPSLGQALELISSDLIQRKLAHPDGLAAHLAASGDTPHDNVRLVFARCFAREPRPDEEQAALEYLASEDDLQSAYQSLIWSLLATNEFIYSH